MKRDHLLGSLFHENNYNFIWQRCKFLQGAWLK